MNEEVKTMQSNENDEMDNLNKEISNQKNIINELNSQIDKKDEILSRTKAYLFNLEYHLDDATAELDSLKEDFSKNDKQLKKIKSELKYLKKQCNSQTSKLDSKEYCISCFKEKIEDKDSEIQYLKKNNFIKKILSPLTPIYLLLKSKRGEIKLNYRLFKTMKNSTCFDIGYYLRNNDEVKNSALCKYFSPELHYVLEGFDKGLKFNKKYFKRNSKNELLKYISKCSK